MNNFTLVIISFVIILMFTGVMSFKFGVSDPRVISGILLGAVMVFDIGWGFFPKQGLATIMIFMINIAAWIKEGAR